MTYRITEPSHYSRSASSDQPRNSCHVMPALELNECNLPTPRNLCSCSRIVISQDCFIRAMFRFGMLLATSPTTTSAFDLPEDVLAATTCPPHVLVVRDVALGHDAVCCRTCLHASALEGARSFESFGASGSSMVLGVIDVAHGLTAVALLAHRVGEMRILTYLGS